ncbi:alpha/beta hydrolase [Antribacter gilvus]|uniref:alpha/beta hydrolase n=1 Tax=Antribacter gilvus TaxID=2304675 RepID=UPI000F79EF20|nr:alpha/beta hydrolase [Antribacter gilvus]
MRSRPAPVPPGAEPLVASGGAYGDAPGHDHAGPPVPGPVLEPGAPEQAAEPEEGWVPDFLPGYEQLALRLEPDEEGEVVATLVRPARRSAPDGAPGAPGESGPARFWRALRESLGLAEAAPPPSAGAEVPDTGVDLLYVHGWQDYFFQTHTADFWEGLGVRFHALDLRKYGRSLHEHQTPGYVTDLATYDEDIEAALAAMGHGEGAQTDRRLLLMGHSTGGLTLSLWTARNQDRVAGLVLNSPWLEFQTREVGRRVLEPGIGAQAALAPRSGVLFLDRGFYVRTISDKLDGEWNLDVRWRSDTASWRPTSGWVAAIFRGHQQVARGLGIEVPVLVLLSARSTPPIRWTEEMRHSDTVLDVAGIARRVPNLGSVTTLVRVDGALHDVTLSAAPVREAVWRELERWYRGYVG